MFSVHLPDLGSEVASPVKVPNKIISVPIPKAKKNKRKKPNTTCLVCATSINKVANIGAVQGAAIKPEPSPNKNAPIIPPFLEVVNFFEDDRKGIGKTSNIFNPKIIQRLATRKFIQGLALICPNIFPESAAKSPRMEYVKAIPRTYDKDNKNPLNLFLPLLAPPI